MKRLILFFFSVPVVVASVLASLPVVAQDFSEPIKDAVAFLSEGVDSLPVRGAPGPIVPFDDNSFPVVLAGYGDSTLAPVVSASFVDRGRVLAFGHTDYCNSDAINATESSRRFFSNALLWTSGKESVAPQNVRVAVWHSRATADYLTGIGFDAFVVNDLKKEFDVFVADAVALNDAQYDALFNRVKRGAGFITCGLGWGWSQLNPDKDLVLEHVGNKNFAKHGVALAWTDGFVSPTDQDSFEINVDKLTMTPYASGTNVLNFIQNLAENADYLQTKLDQTTGDQLRQLSASFSLILPFLSPDKRAIVDRLAEDLHGDILPTATDPIKDVDLIQRLAMLVQSERYLRGQIVGRTKPEDVPALPAALDFPGEVPKDAPRIDEAIVPIKTAVPDWASTGLYAAPGETITVKVDSGILARIPQPFKVRIGTHSDSIIHLKEWVRYPEISVEKIIQDPETRIANPFGGLVYIVVPRDIGSLGLGIVEFKISGAVAAPYFVRDETSLDTWQTLRNNPAPWAELQGKNVIVTVPSTAVRELENPQYLMETWDEILALEAEFASGPYVRERPERITCDREISAGYMHSGYPVMTHMDVEKALVDADRLRIEGDWGFYHEFGHNHQSPYWTFEGTTEVTVNYFTLYIMEKFNGKRAEVAKSDLTRESQNQKMSAYFKNGAKFSDWEDDPFLALIMTIQMREKFGWEPFLRAINEYTKASPEELPQNDQEKRDQWMVRLSRNSGLNLGRFFTTWGIPISQEALDSVKELPEWFPENLGQ